jgi:hypothetical protein
MVALGVHFAMTTEMAARLSLNRPHTNADVIAFIEYLDSQFHALHAEGWVQETEKAWDGIHRCLSDGKLERGDTPGHSCILGSTDSFCVVQDDGELQWIVNLLDPDEVRRVAAAIQGIDRADLRRRYDCIDPESYYWFCMSEDDFEYTWDYFRRLQAFFQRAADAGRWVLFRADQ